MSLFGCFSEAIISFGARYGSCANGNTAGTTPVACGDSGSAFGVASSCRTTARRIAVARVRGLNGGGCCGIVNAMGTTGKDSYGTAGIRTIVRGGGLSSDLKFSIGTLG